MMLSHATAKSRAQFRQQQKQQAAENVRLAQAAFGGASRCALCLENAILTAHRVWRR
jgi:hypothetical protein